MSASPYVPPAGTTTVTSADRRERNARLRATIAEAIRGIPGVEQDDVRVIHNDLGRKDALRVAEERLRAAGLNPLVRLDPRGDRLLIWAMPV